LLENSEGAFLLITGTFRQQWCLPLDQHTCNVLLCYNFRSKDLHDDANFNSFIIMQKVLFLINLREFKQLSVEKLTFFKNENQ